MKFDEAVKNYLIEAIDYPEVKSILDLKYSKVYDHQTIPGNGPYRFSYKGKNYAMDLVLGILKNEDDGNFVCKYDRKDRRISDRDMEEAYGKFMTHLFGKKTYNDYFIGKIK